MNGFAVVTAERRRLVIAVVAGVVAVLAVVLVPPGSSRGGPVAPSCAVADGPLPDWARGGFSDPVQPHVLGDRGDIVAVLWGPLSAPPAADRANKILWVARDPGTGPLTISAHRGAEPPVVQVVRDGPGPSTVDLPAPGCWTLDLAWSGHADTVRLDYAP